MSSTFGSPPDRRPFFVDRSFGSRLVYEALVGAGHPAIRHDDLFAPDAEDTEWLQYAGSEGLIVLTRDQRIRTRGTEVAMFVAAEVRAFIFSSRKMSGAEAAALVVSAAPKMQELALAESPPFCFSVTRGPNITPLAIPMLDELAPGPVRDDGRDTPGR